MLATTVRVDARIDERVPSTWFMSPRRDLRGWGRAMVIDVPQPWPDHLHMVVNALAAFDVESDMDIPGGGPVAFAALPFDRAAMARFVVPSRIEGSTADGARWLTTVRGAAPSDVARLDARRGTDAPPRSVTARSSVSESEWCESVAEATKRIAEGRVTKVVLAREIEVTADSDLDAATIGMRLASAHPGALRFCVDGFTGASPELLVSRLGDVVRAQPMAGTTPRTGDPAVDSRRAAELLSSPKNRDEHQITIDVVHEALLPWCSYLDAEPEPHVAEAGPVQHLATMVEGRLSHPAPSVLELVAALHPTPAVGGWPRDEALALIAELEPADRGKYAGPVGWVDREGNGAWAVGIRSVQIDGGIARVFAGVGVVDGSDPADELEETRAKLAATLPAVMRL